MHIGSQITELEPFVHAADKIFDIVDALAQNGIMLDHLDFGGGLGVRYTDETSPSAETLVKAVSRKLLNAVMPICRFTLSRDALWWLAPVSCSLPWNTSSRRKPKTS